MATVSTSRLVLAFGLAAGAAALLTVLLTRPRGQQSVAAVPAAPTRDERSRRLREVVQQDQPDLFTPQLSLQAKPGSAVIG